MGGKDKNEGEPVAGLEAVKDFEDDDGIEGVRRADSDVGHDVDEDVFLDVPRSWVQAELDGVGEGEWAQDMEQRARHRQRNHPRGEVRKRNSVRRNGEGECQELADGIRQQQKHERHDRGRW